ncbi:hypothetical protein MOQ72_11055 [Saccharopolyspora sp. K220]|nr:hypothetical protein [Saccharopolyspora soli]MCI2417963.1 hypothetical protein [Saccharopolyspora soli]
MAVQGDESAPTQFSPDSARHAEGTRRHGEFLDACASLEPRFEREHR